MKNTTTQDLNKKNKKEKIVFWFLVIVTIIIILLLFQRFLTTFINDKNRKVLTGNMDIFEIKCNDNCFCSEKNPTINKLDDDSSLTNIFINKGTLHFDKNIYNYNVLLENSVDKITLSATKSSNNSSLYYIYNKKIYSSFSDIPIVVGENVITIAVIAENGNLTNYRVIVTRLNNNGDIIKPVVKDTDSSLRNLTISNGNLLFEKSKISYTVFVDDDVRKITLVATKESEKSTVSYIYNGKNYNEFRDIEITEESNIVTVLVTAEDGTSTSYVVLIAKKSADYLKWYSTNNLNIFTNPVYENEAILAPGSFNSYEFVVSNKVNNKVKYQFEFNEKSDYEINMKYRLKRNGEYLVGDEKNWVKFSELNIGEIEIDANKEDDYILDWKWFDSENDSLIGELQDDYTLSITLSAIIQ